MDSGALRATVYGVTKNGTRVSDSCCYIQKLECVSLYFLLQGIFLTQELSLHSPALDFPGGSDGKASAYNVGDPGSIPGWGRSPGEGNGNPLQYSCLENPVDSGAW